MEIEFWIKFIFNFHFHQSCLPYIIANLNNAVESFIYASFKNEIYLR